MDSDNKRDDLLGNEPEATKGTCPRCGEPTQPNATGRPPIWCSQGCRRAAYEERRAAAGGAIGIKVVDRIHTLEHPIKVCVNRTIGSPVGCRRVISELAQLAWEGSLQSDPKWATTSTALIELIYAIQPRPSRRW